MVDSIDIKIDEVMPVKDIQISCVESNTEDTAEEEEEQVQESEKEDSKSDNEGTDVTFLSIRQYYVRILSERISCTSINHKRQWTQIFFFSRKP